MKLSGTPTHILPTLCEDEKRALSTAREKNCMSMPQLIDFQQLIRCRFHYVFGRCLSPEWCLLDELTREKIRSDKVSLPTTHLYETAVDNTSSECRCCDLIQGDTSLEATQKR